MGARITELRDEDETLEDRGEAALLFEGVTIDDDAVELAEELCRGDIFGDGGEFRFLRFAVLIDLTDCGDVEPFDAFGTLLTTFLGLGAIAGLGAMEGGTVDRFGGVE